MIEVIFYSTAYLILFAISEYLYHVLKLNVEVTRKVVHVSTGLIALTFPIYLHNFWQVLVLCLLFLGLLAIAEKFKWLKSITAVERRSYGSWLFALIVLVCFYAQLELSNSSLYYLPLFILTICDPIAAAAGKRLNLVPIKILGSVKSIGGSLAFFISCFLVLVVYNSIASISWPLGYTALMSLSIALLELVSIRGWDNLTIPLGAMGFVYMAGSLF
ncbi:MAG: phosphatidate cytidylyltransferase [Bacteroidia bacterium]|nr:phosphatidate cytidylyltransferase [Bacteroidia bacterium]